MCFVLRLHAAIPFVRENSCKCVGTFIPYRLTGIGAKAPFNGGFAFAWLSTGLCPPSALRFVREWGGGGGVNTWICFTQNQSQYWACSAGTCSCSYVTDIVVYKSGTTYLPHGQITIFTKVMNTLQYYAHYKWYKSCTCTYNVLFSFQDRNQNTSGI